MAFIFCDDHDVSVEADGIEPAEARRLMLGEPKSNPSAIEKELIDFGKAHRDCNVRVLAG